jgi:hypothetical protein
MTVFSTGKSSAQDFQVWLDAYAVKPFGYFENEVNIGYDRLLKENGWRDYYICNTLTYQRISWFAAEAAVEFHHTDDPEAVDINEIRVFASARFNFATYMPKIHLQLPYFYLRVEERNLFYPEDNTSEQKLRLRPRLGGRFLLNNNYITDNTFYIPFYYEFFINFNGEAFERYASRNRFMAGLGYGITNKARAELMYFAQRSRNSIEDSFVRTDTMFQLNFRYYFLKE